MDSINTENYRKSLLMAYENQKNNLFSEIKRINQKEEKIINASKFNISELGNAIAYLISLINQDDYEFIELDVTRLYAFSLINISADNGKAGYIIKKSDKEKTIEEIKKLYHECSLSNDENFLSSRTFDKIIQVKEYLSNYHQKIYNPNDSYILFSIYDNNDSQIDASLKFEEPLLTPNKNKGLKIIDKKYEYIYDFIQGVIQNRLTQITLSGTDENSKSLNEMVEDYASNYSKTRLILK